jgi:hypothetical protein
VHNSSTFRFPGFLFSRKSEKSKHSSLKRAKSGIQLERKGGKPSLAATASAAPSTPTKTAEETKQQHSTQNAADLEQRNK